MAFVLKNVIRKISPDLLQEYCHKNNISFSTKNNESLEDSTNRFIDTFENSNHEEQRKIESDFQEIYELTPTNGFLNLLDEAKQQNIDLPEELETMNPYDKSIWFFLNESNIFNEAQAWYEAQETTGWKEAFVNKHEFNETLNKTQELSEELSQYLYTTEMRGRICNVECFVKNDRILYVAYPKDYVKLDIGYDEKQKLNKKMQTEPVLKIYFLFYPEKGLLSIKSKGGIKKIKEFHKIFVEKVLNDSKDTIKYRTYELNKLKDPMFSFPTEPQDQVEYVKIKSISFSYPLNYQKGYQRITLVLNPDNLKKHGIEEIQNFIKESNMPTNLLNITQVILATKFKSSQKGIRGTVTAQISYPNTINLKNTHFHRKLKSYLFKWGLYQEANNEELAEII